MVTKSIAAPKLPAKKVPARKIPTKAPAKGLAPPKESARSVSEAVPASEPTQVRFFLADDMRREVGGKVTAVGLYADNVIVAEMLPSGPDPTPERLGVVPSIAVLANISAAPGEHRYKLEIDSSSAVPTIMEQQTVTLVTPESGGTVNLIMPFSPFLFTRFGMVHLVLRVDGLPYRYSFEIRRRNKGA